MLGCHATLFKVSEKLRDKLADKRSFCAWLRDIPFPACDIESEVDWERPTAGQLPKQSKKIEIFYEDSVKLISKFELAAL